jgi:PadR family transcriptional regulator PadR
MAAGTSVDLSQLLKGVLDLAVLAVLADRDSYGYEVLRRLRESGLHGVGDASVYGTLRRLFQAGALTSYVVPSDEGPHRRYYGLSARGAATLAESARTWHSVTQAVDTLLYGKEDQRHDQGGRRGELWRGGPRRPRRPRVRRA